MASDLLGALPSDNTPLTQSENRTAGLLFGNQQPAPPRSNGQFPGHSQMHMRPPQRMGMHPGMGMHSGHAGSQMGEPSTTKSPVKHKEIERAVLAGILAVIACQDVFNRFIQSYISAANMSAVLYLVKFIIVVIIYYIVDRFWLGRV